MAEFDDRDQRTEQPTQKRLQDARERGQVPRSRELAGTAVMLSAAGTILLAGGYIANVLGDAMRSGLTIPRAALDRPEAMFAALGNATLYAGAALAPVLAVTLAAALLAPAAIGGFVFSSQALAPDFTRLDPVAGIRRIFGLQGLMELAKALAKFLVVGAAAAGVVWVLMDRIVGLGSMSVGAAIGEAAHLLGLATLLLSAALGLIAAVDAPFQVWSHRRNLRMTREEIREEMKETDGRPEVKGRIRRLQQQMARRRMMQQVPAADVVITNPTHYSVALKYEPARMKAPRVVAKGRDLVALEIRRVAREHGVPVFEAPPLARALYATTELNREIPSGLYLAVAQVLSYVFQLKTAGRDAWKLRRPEPQVDAEYLRS